MLGQPPLVLSIGPELQAKLFVGIGDVKRRVDRRQAVRIVRVERLNRARGCDPGLLALGIEAGANGVRIVQAVRKVAGHAIEE